MSDPTVIIQQQHLEDDTSREFIFHFTRRDLAIEKILPHLLLKFSALSHMNDPLEYQDYLFSTSLMLSPKELKAIDRINHFLKLGIKVCCFSEDFLTRRYPGTLNCGFGRPRMWSQYGSNHSGLCLVFRKTELYLNLLGNVRAIKLPYGAEVDIFRGSVSYEDDFSYLSEALTIKDVKDVDGFVQRHIEKYSGVLMFRKHKDWESESEYRVALYSKHFESDQEMLVGLGNSLEALILGGKFPREYLVNIFEASERTGVPIFQMQWENGNPSLATLKTRAIGSKKYDAALF